MFSQMTGLENAEIPVLLDKMVELYKCLTKYHKVLKILLDF